MMRRTFLLALSAWLVGCGAGSSGPGPEVQVPSTQDPSPQDEYDREVTGTLTVVDGSYVVTDGNGAVRVRVGLEDLPGTHVVVDNTVEIYNGGQLPYAVIGDLS